MANWIEKINATIQVFISKNRKMMEVTKLNVEISNLSQEKRMLLAQIGECTIEHNLSNGNATISGLKAKIEDLNSRIESAQEKVWKIREINICPACRIEVSRNIKFCPKCGMELEEGKGADENENM